MSLQRLLPVLIVAVLAAGGGALWLQPQLSDAGSGAPPDTGMTVGDALLATESAGSTRLSEQFLILAASWQPAFCETAPRRPECTSMTAERYDASHFALHGLWPQGEYCGVPTAIAERDRTGSWSDLPPVELDAELAARLSRTMPGTQSGLERHEWIKHGTCLGGSAAQYYEISLAFMAALNASGVREQFADNVGGRLTRADIRDAFDAAFGAGAGQRVRVSCVEDDGRLLIDEITIGLWGVPAPEADFGALMLAARPTDGGCDGGIVDPVGDQ